MNEFLIKMQSKVTTVKAYIDSLPDSRKGIIIKLRETLVKNLPEGFEEQMTYGMPGFVVPHKVYPEGYHVNPQLPLPFVSYASQKNHIALYHMAIYSFPEILEWFTNEYPKHSKTRLDIGKSCIRFKNPENIPFSLIAELASKITMQEWVDVYKSLISRQ